VKCLSTRQAAKLVGIDRSTIQKWIRLKRVEAPTVTLQGRRKVRCWNKAGLTRLRELKQAWDREQAFWDYGHALMDAEKKRREKEKLEKQKQAETKT
jgi:excisionase family DNA binding protein